MSEPPAKPVPIVRRPRRSRKPAWVKLFAAAIVANALGFGVAIWVSGSIRAVPESAGAEQWLRFAYFAALIVIAACDALLLDELLFKGAFRRTHIEGKTARHLERGQDVGALVVSMQRSTITFPFMALAGGMVTYFLFNLVNHDFDVYYRRIGKDISLLHHGQTDQQIAAVSRLAIHREPEVLPALKWRLDQGGEPAAWSAWALGRFADLPTYKPLIVPLVEASQSRDPAIRREALVALGRLQHRGGLEAITAEARAEFERGQEVDPRLMYGLGAMQTMSSVSLLSELLVRGRPATQELAAWALAQHRDQVGGREVVQILEDRLPTATLPLRCAIVHSLGILTDERTNLALMRAYDDSTASERTQICERRRLNMYPPGGESVPYADTDHTFLFVPQESFALKVIRVMAQMRAQSSDVRAQVEPWLEAQMADEGATAGLRDMAAQLLAGIREQRDDSQLPQSIEQALQKPAGQ